MNWKFFDLRIYLIAFLISGTVPLFVVSANAVDFRFQVGASYVNGFNEVADRYESNLEAEGYIVTDITSIPVGIFFSPYIQTDFGLLIGAGLGPAMLIMGDAKFTDIPMNIYIGSSIPNANVSPYIKGGLSYHNVSGDYVAGSSRGLYGAIGIEFLRNRKVGFGFEVAVDTAEIELEKYRSTGSWSYMKAGTEKIQPTALMIRAFAVF